MWTPWGREAPAQQRVPPGVPSLQGCPQARPAKNPLEVDSDLRHRPSGQFTPLMVKEGTITCAHVSACASTRPHPRANLGWEPKREKTWQLLESARADNPAPPSTASVSVNHGAAGQFLYRAVGVALVTALIKTPPSDQHQRRQHINASPWAPPPPSKATWSRHSFSILLDTHAAHLNNAALGARSKKARKGHRGDSDSPAGTSRPPSGRRAARATGLASLPTPPPPDLLQG